MSDWPRWLDAYAIKARLFPALLTLPPYVLLYDAFVREELRQVISRAVSFEIPLGVGISFEVSLGLLFVFVLALVNRRIGKDGWEQVYFEGEQHMPTTDFLLHSNDELSPQYKAQIRDQIEEDVGRALPSEQEEEENEADSRRRIAEAVAQIRGTVSPGRLIRSHNIEYGFVRNLIGGATLAFVVSCLGWWLLPVGTSGRMQGMVILAGFYLLPILLSGWAIRRYGRDYARVFFREYTMTG